MNRHHIDKSIDDTKKGEGQGLFLIVIMAVLGLLTIFVETMLVPGLPNIAQDLTVGSSDLAWVLTAYTLAGAMSIPMVGKLGEMFGRKRVLLSIMIVYMVGLIGAAVSWNLISLVVFRAVQGVGMGAIPLLMGMAKDVLPPRMVPVGIGLISAMMGVGAGLGLVIGGLIISQVGWKDAFWVTLPVVALVTVLVQRVVPDVQQKRLARLDTVGSVLLGAALLALLLVLSRGPTWGWTSLTALGLALTTVVLFVLFVRWERRYSEPIIDLRLLKDRNISSAYLSILFIGIVMFMLFQTLPFYLEMPEEVGGFGMSDQVLIGLYMLPNAITQLIFSPLGGRWGQRIGHSRILVLGFVVTATGLFVLSLLRSSPMGVVLSVTIFGSGIGLATVGNTNVLASSCTRETFGSATAVNSTILTIGMSTGPVLAGLIIGSFDDPGTGYSITWVLAAILALAAIAAVLLNRIDLRALPAHPSAEERS